MKGDFQETFVADLEKAKKLAAAGVSEGYKEPAGGGGQDAVVESSSAQAVHQEAAGAEALPEEQDSGTRACKSKGTVADDCSRLRKHLKLGRARKEICALEGWSLGKYRYVRRWLGTSFRYSNAEAFSDYLAGEQARLEEVQADIEAARGRWEWKTVATLQRLSFDVRHGIFEMAMKLGVLEKAEDRLRVRHLREVSVGFGDELLKPNWPSLEETVQ